MNHLEEICASPVERLIPHRPPMVLLTRAVGLVEGWFLAEVDVSADSPFAQAEGVPAYVGIEYMAQAVAAYAGAEGVHNGGRVQVGMLLGSREYACSGAWFALGSRLRVRVRKLLYQPGGISAMDCRIADATTGVELAQAQLTVVQVEDLSLLGGA